MESVSFGVILLNVVEIFFWIYMIMLFLRILASWIPELQGTKILLFIAFYTDPYLNLFRRLIPPIGMLDISPIAAFFCLSLLERAVKWIIIALFFSKMH